ncbi:MAG: DegT/DnrJ/EryC1/StrS family aminotransferase, partial [Bacteroidales bacterium]|nr:DegT/DnrJ/EryC1/StrS family aminotransferase [Bacteroidales bacterium]
ISALDEMLVRRKKNAETYSNYLEKKEKTFVPKNLFNDHSFLKYPFLVKERNEVMRIAEKCKVPLGEWFCSPIHPVRKQFEQWNFLECDFPVATKYSNQILNLPTDVADVTPILRFLEKIEDYLL